MEAKIFVLKTFSVVKESSRGDKVLERDKGTEKNSLYIAGAR